MKFLGTDFSLKYIIAKIDGKNITISWRSTYWRGVYDISIRINEKTEPATPTEIKSVYPGFKRRILEKALLIQLYLKNAIKKGESK